MLGDVLRSRRLHILLAIAFGYLAWQLWLTLAAPHKIAGLEGASEKVNILVTLPCIRVTGSTRDYLYVVTAITASIALAGTILGLAFYRRYYSRQGAPPAESGGRGGFMAALGLMLSGVSFLAILVQSAALPFAEFCE